MKTELIFKLEHSPIGYNEKFSQDCKIDIKNTKGILYLDNRNQHAIGHFNNLRLEGENVVADVEIFQHFKDITHRFEYSIEGRVVSKNEKKEVENAQIYSVSARMPPKD